MWAWILCGALIGMWLGQYIAKDRVVGHMIENRVFDTRSERHQVSFKDMNLRSKVYTVAMTSGLLLGGLVLGTSLGFVWQLVSLVSHLVQVSS